MESVTYSVHLRRVCKQSLNRKSVQLAPILRVSVAVGEAEHENQAEKRE
jgi:hypothetical protein